MDNQGQEDTATFELPMSSIIIETHRQVAEACRDHTHGQTDRQTEQRAVIDLLVVNSAFKLFNNRSMEG